ncbi:hypothetical protein BCV69DRAFT_281766 [Microstroma glucosiphilum]|uniref:Uncharacterized protein n=1 Tax=Pseudomicrostroma glucosiphilum TaxID=1684307 RepID=A0A316UBR6_9BASI|nr:hypothetical protein BCV69DRAFT_281766 [Pseudomicrostroma glucosiphilum]PWN21853.1 hypothetical protein BCV69DRAFT_281766 [Pseudomicrostroma glucosiphilum]
MATTAPPPVYPDYDSIPSTSAPQPRPSRIPAPILHLFSLFPLVTFPAPSSHESPPTTLPPAIPQLNVLPGHVRTDAQGQSRTTWTSRDVRCLTSQVEFLFRKVDFETRQLEREEAWGPKVRGLPFVHLPQARPSRSGTATPPAAVAASSAAPPRLLAADSIPTWVETLAPFPYERAETGREASEPYPSPTAKAEAEMWTTLLQKGVMAAVLLAQLSCETPPSSHKPFFSSQVQSHLANQYLAREGNLINSLSSSASASTSLSRWSSFVPGMSFSWIGLGVSGIGSSNDDGEEGTGTEVTSAAWPEELDVDAVIAEGVDGIQAVGKKMARQSDGKEWFLGAR